MAVGQDDAFHPFGAFHEISDVGMTMSMPLHVAFREPSVDVDHQRALVLEHHHVFPIATDAAKQDDRPAAWPAGQRDCYNGLLGTAPGRLEQAKLLRNRRAAGRQAERRWAPRASLC